MPPPAPQLFGDEAHDFSIPPQTALKAAVGTPTPLLIPGARTVTTVQVMNELRQSHHMVLVDSLQDSHPATISTAVYLPFAGQYGTFNDQAQAMLANELGRLTQGHREIPIVFFCQGIRCWESYNAALRALAAGYPNVFWYRGGLVAWQQAGFPMQPLAPR